MANIHGPKWTYFVILFFIGAQVLDVSAQAPILSPASEICPGDDLTFTCTVPSAVIEWMYMGMTRPATAGELGGVIDPLGPFQVEVVDRTEGSGSVFTSVTSTITATADTAMDGEMVTCVNAGAGGDNSRSAVVNIIIDNIQIMSSTESSLNCVMVTLQQPTNTTGIMSYTVVATLGNMGMSEGTSDDGDDLTVEVCGLSLCSYNYMFQARANGGFVCPSELMSFTPTLPSMDQVSNVRLGDDGSTLEWDAPSNALSAGCIILSYTISVSGLPSGRITSTTSTSTTSESFSAIDSQLDTCDSRLNITISANVATIGLVGSSISNSFVPSSVFPSTPVVAISGNGVMYTSSDIRVPFTADVTTGFPDAEFRIEYSGGCAGSSQAQDDVALFDYSCLDESAITITATYVDLPDCTSDTVIVQIPQPPLFPSIRLQPTVRVESDSAEVSYSGSSMIAADNFNTVGTVFQSNGNTIITSDTSTYPANVVFEDLFSNTSYTYILQVVSKDDSSIIIASFSGTFTTARILTDMKLTTSEAIGITVVITFLVSFTAGGMVVGLGVYCYLIRKQKGKYFPREESQLEPAPMYEEVSTHLQPQKIELKENIAYGPVQ